MGGHSEPSENPSGSVGPRLVEFAFVLPDKLLQQVLKNAIQHCERIPVNYRMKPDNQSYNLTLHLNG